MQFKNLIQRGRTAFAANKTVAGKHDRHTLQIVGMLTVLAVALLPELALAGPLDSASTAILNVLTSGWLRTAAIIAVIALGVTAWGGRLSWERAIHIGGGIVAVFGAATFVDVVINAVS